MCTIPDTRLMHAESLLQSFCLVLRHKIKCLKAEWCHGWSVFGSWLVLRRGHLYMRGMRCICGMTSDASCLQCMQCSLCALILSLCFWATDHTNSMHTMFHNYTQLACSYVPASYHLSSAFTLRRQCPIKWARSPGIWTTIGREDERRAGPVTSCAGPLLMRIVFLQHTLCAGTWHEKGLMRSEPSAAPQAHIRS